MKQQVTLIEPLDIMTRAERYILQIKNSMQIKNEMPRCDTINIPTNHIDTLGTSYIELILHESQQIGFWVPQLIEDNILESYLNNELFLYVHSQVDIKKKKRMPFILNKIRLDQITEYSTINLIQRHLTEKTKKELYATYPIENFNKYTKQNPAIEKLLRKKIPTLDSWIQYWKENEPKLNFYTEEDQEKTIKIIETCYPLLAFEKPQRTSINQAIIID